MFLDSPLSPLCFNAWDLDPGLGPPPLPREFASHVPAISHPLVPTSQESNLSSIIAASFNFCDNILDSDVNLSLDLLSLTSIIVKSFQLVLE